MAFIAETVNTDGRDRFKVTCSCGRAITTDEGGPWRHACKDAGDEWVTYIPTDFDPHAFTAMLKQRQQEKHPAPEGPGLLRRAANFAKATVNHTFNVFRNATDEEVDARFAICKSNQCGLFKYVAPGEGRCLHSSCGCTLNTVSAEKNLGLNKLRWEEQACPRGFWKRIVRELTNE